MTAVLRLEVKDPQVVTPVEFPKFGKMPRWWKPFTITEKVDGTNGVIRVWDEDNVPFGAPVLTRVAEDVFSPIRYIAAGSRNRWLYPDSDNYGFAQWVLDHAQDAARLGPGVHYGEWYGSGINRGYGLPKDVRKFALFNADRWEDNRPAAFDVVPVLWRGSGDDLSAGIRGALDVLNIDGSYISPGFHPAEGIVIRSNENNVFWKKYLVNDRNPKG